MKSSTKTAIIMVLACSFPAGHALASSLAFPGAEGHGAYAVGGRGGDVYYVTNLNDSGAGSLRQGIATAGGTASTGRTIVFEVSGTIVLTSNLNINRSYITIAGQTAPGDGICLRDRSLRVNASHVIVRYIRVRLGDESLTEEDGIWIQSGSNIIMDHVSASWSVDEVFSTSTSVAGLTNVTVQWSLITEALNNSIHGKGAHGYGALIRGCYDSRFSYHHNLWVHNAGRNPRPGNYDENPHTIDPCGLLFDFRNNVIYNWSGSRPGAEYDTLSVCRYNYVGNWARPGANSTAGGLFLTTCKHFRGFFAGNYFNGTYAADDWVWVTFSGTWTTAERNAYKQSAPFPTGPMMTDTALVAYERVLHHAGASLPKRDIVDTRLVNDVRNNTGVIIDTQNQVGGWPTLRSAAPPLDTDRDGMPDAWEIANGLNPSNAADRNSYTFSTDYTNLEIYLNGLVPNGTYDADVTAPTPNALVWERPPTTLSGTQITMTASPATDPWGVEYYFACTSGGGPDSGWRMSNSWTATGLVPGQTYVYVVLARDKSAALNETAWSAAESATTLPYTCIGSIAGDINGDCQVNMLDFAMMVDIWPWPDPPGNFVANGDFATGISGWPMITLTGSTGTVASTWASAEGSPAGAAYLTKTGTTEAKKRRFYQVIPVTKGRQYQLSGSWKGSIIGSVVSGTSATPRNWAEVYVGWSDTASPDWGPVTLMYHKAIAPNSRLNISTSGVWDWESIVSSRAGNWAPSNGVFTAKGDYMVIAFNIGATSNSGTTWMWLDNIGVQEVNWCPPVDLNGDCLVDMKDAAVIFDAWLNCNRNPSGECWI
ncbi:MAG TPA: hypothetical protein VLH60_04425 [Sedimentisphaerales bacterium]|nr:hypothetical protein [Sedimentisphaerales bacterium]